MYNFYNKHKICTYRYPKIESGPNKVKTITVNSKIPYLNLLINGPWKAILKEVQDIDQLFVPHRDSSQTKGWSSLCLHGLGWNITDTPAMYPQFKNIPEDQLRYSWTAIAAQCPVA